MPTEFTEQGSSARPIIGSNKSPPRLPGILVGKRASVVVSTQETPLFAVGVPMHDEVPHRDARTVFRMSHIERLPADLSSQLVEVVRQKFLLSGHAFGAAGPWADFADPLQQRIRGLSIDGDRRDRAPCAPRATSCWSSCARSRSGF